MLTCKNILITEVGGVALLFKIRSGSTAPFFGELLEVLPLRALALHFFKFKFFIVTHNLGEMKSRSNII